MSAQAIIRVFCVDGPFTGVRYLDADSGAVMFIDHPDIAECFYKVDASLTSRAETPGYPTAYFSHLRRHDATPG